MIITTNHNKNKLKTQLWNFTLRILKVFVIILMLIFAVNLQSCRDDSFDTSPSLKLEFSTDSLLFDTVFTTIGSSTRFFKIYNNHNSRVNISSIQIASGSNSFFRINVDGRSGNQFQNVEVGAKDSLFVFVEVNVDPLQQDLPLIISDSVIFHINNNIQNVKLIAWGQDSHFIRPNAIDTASGFQFHLITENTVWSGPKPYVVYGLVLIAPDVTLTVKEDTRVHFHNRSGMIFLGRSSLKVQGQLEQPVIFQGDRLEADYRELPGQWGYIWLTATSRNHEIDHAIIKNATYGIILDSIGSFTEPTLRIRNTIIKNMDQVGFDARGSYVVAENLVVANCGLHAIYLGLGGNYDFRHTTIANYYWLGIRQTPSLVFNNYYVDTAGTVQLRDFERIYFGNSILMGSLQEEIGLDFFPGPEVADFIFDHCLVRTALNNQHSEKFLNSLLNLQPQFRDTRENDYRLMEDSPVIGSGKPGISSAIPLDILGNSRVERSDIGAYQYYEIEEEEDEE
jgi:hypothetical protein